MPIAVIAVKVDAAERLRLKVVRPGIITE